ncbi:MAG: sugar phosphate isomerase/epimerase [Propionibacteriaceae bacterium]|jgi:sugar phosphate isomerase/epimerase|nr:sugar phosphate isomerase/epimerase [Propionibacteriaceae bacterium]
MTIKRGVSLYSYQQTQFFKRLDLEGQLREISENLGGADGVELLDEMSLHYPEPPAEFDRQWFGWMERYGLVPVTMDVFHDVLQFRDHVMTYHESAERLIHDIKLAKRLGFKNVRTLATTPVEIMVEALPVAEELDIRLGKEIHQPITLDGQYVTEIVEHVRNTGTEHLGIVPDFGIFAFRPTEVLLDWYVRHGAQQATCDLVVELCLETHYGQGNALSAIDMSRHTAGNIRSGFTRFLKTGEAEPDVAPAFALMKQLVDDNVPHHSDIDYTVMAEALLFSRTKPEELKELLPLIVSIHGKFLNMSEIPGRPGHYQDISFDYEGPIRALKEAGYDGYINSEYEGQRYWQDRTEADLADEVDQVRRHQEMLRRLIDAPLDPPAAA